MRVPWSIWPPDLKGNDNQWSNVTKFTVHQIVQHGKQVFPLIPATHPFSCVSIQDPSIVVANPQPDISLEILSSLGLRITQPPKHIYDILQTAKNLYKAALLSRSAVHERLLQIFPNAEAPNCSIAVREIMIDYLSSAQAATPTPSLVTGISWFTLEDGSHACLGRGSPTYIVPTSDEELSLFGGLSSVMLKWDGMSSRFRSIASSSSNFAALNVTTIRPDHIISMLNAKLGAAFGSDSARADSHQWLIKFWTWIVHWVHFQEFCSQSARYSQLPLLPKSDGGIGRYWEILR